jgi:hypothetical protein
MANFAFQHYDAIFKITQPLVHGCFVVSGGLCRCGCLRLLTHGGNSGCNHPNNKDMKTPQMILLLARWKKPWLTFAESAGIRPVLLEDQQD